MSEKNDVVNPIREIVAERGGKVLKLQPQPRSGIEKGTPDLVGSYRGVALAIECKLPGNKPTAIQERRLKEWTEAGAIVAVVSSPREATMILDVIDSSLRAWTVCNLRAMILAEDPS